MWMMALLVARHQPVTIVVALIATMVSVVTQIRVGVSAKLITPERFLVGMGRGAPSKKIIFAMAKMPARGSPHVQADHGAALSFHRGLR